MDQRHRHLVLDVQCVSPVRLVESSRETNVCKWMCGPINNYEMYWYLWLRKRVEREETQRERERESVSTSSCQRETWTERNISGTASAGKIKKK